MRCAVCDTGLAKLQQCAHELYKKHQCVCVYRCPGVQVLVDGAHALGQLPVDLQKLGPDFFVSNCHKWLCAPRGSAILWVKRACQDGFVPLVKSHGHGEGFTSDFIWDGARHCLLHVLVCQTAHPEPSDRPSTAQSLASSIPRQLQAVATTARTWRCLAHLGGGAPMAQIRSGCTVARSYQKRWRC